MSARSRAMLKAVRVGAHAAAFALALLPFSTAAAQQIPIKAGVTVSPDSVRIGDPFRVTVGIRAPKGATIEFPRAADSSGTVQSLDPAVVRTSADTGGVEQYADYRVAAWDIGTQAVKLGDVVIRLNGATRRVPVVGGAVFVKSLLPADTALRVPKPLRPLFEFTTFPWWILALIAAAIAIGLFIWWWITHRRKRPAPISVDPFAHADAEFKRIEALGLLEAGERGRYVTLMIEILRDYLAARYAQAAALSLTSTELQRSVREKPMVPLDRLTRVLTDADLIKFARRAVSTDRARDLGREARSIVAAEHQASQPAVIVPQEKAA
ncbi:MAG: hypothetical protein ABI442_09250 [Gemmatimonadaceae bacterium]